MKNHEGDFRGYTQLSRAWYGEANLRSGNIVDDVTFGFYPSDGGTSGEMTVFWEKLGNKVSPCLKVWDDAWHTLYEFRDVLKLMADRDGEDISPKQFCQILDKCGFKDQTEMNRKN